MKATRRTFFGLMGATPIVAKAAADAEMAKVAKLDVSGLGATGQSAGRMGAQAIPSAISWEARMTGASDYISAFGVPEFYQSEIRNNTREVDALDPDIACKRSWSMSVKIMTQRQRNYDVYVANLKANAGRTRARAALNKILGFDWPF